MKRARFQRIVVGNRNQVEGRASVPKSHVAAFLTERFVSKAFKGTNHKGGGYTAREFHAASTEISSSLT
jgi:hypothetical protein